MSGWLALALLLLASPAWATPITFYGDPGFGSDWLVSGSAPVFPYQYEPGQLLALVGIVPYTRQIGSFPFTATWVLDGGQPLIERTMMPEFDYGPLDDCRYGCPVIFEAIARFDLAAAITGWGPHTLALTLSVPNDTREYDFDVQQPAAEPGTIALFGATLLLLGWGWRRRFHVEH